MGHARNYVNIDINRRVLQNYFHYNVKFIQNVTDIDDKIILKAREEYLMNQYVKSQGGKVTPDFVAKAQTGLAQYMAKNLPEFTGKPEAFNSWAATLDLDTLKIQKPKLPMHVKACKAALGAISRGKGSDEKSFEIDTKDVIMPVLDAELGSTVTDPAIFRNCASYWERQYDNDMRRLNVLPPTVVTRVSEYIPEIVKFVSGIIDNGFGYVTKDGSVYFNTAKFDADPRHTYAKNQPWSKHDLALIEDAEGSLSLDHPESKLNSSDFALWKASKRGEPSWKSPWGQGRPGWHIECSVMASDFFGDGLDIHSGGIDLAFPHHDNESAQSEAFFNCSQWVDYFLHTGHLHIKGQKMSKSLKNFITIQDALKTYSSRELRLCFALVQWNNPLDFKDSLLAEARSIQSTFSKFFQKVRALRLDEETRLEAGELLSKKYRPQEKALFGQLDQAKQDVYKALCDNISTPVAIHTLNDLVTDANTYAADAGTEVRVDLLVNVARYVTKMMSVFGFPVRADSLGWVDDGNATDDSGASGSSEQSGSFQSVEEVAMPYVQLLSKFRDLVRKTAIAKGNYKDLLEACDEIRDRDLLKLNVALDDRTKNQAALVKFITDEEKDELINQQKERDAAQAEKLKRKEQQRLQNAKREAEWAEKAKVDPKEMFQTPECKKLYSAWDEEGIPQKDIKGEELSKSARKKLTKKWKNQKKNHDKYLKQSSK